MVFGVLSVNYLSQLSLYNLKICITVTCGIKHDIYGILYKNVDIVAVQYYQYIGVVLIADRVWRVISDGRPLALGTGVR